MVATQTTIADPPVGSPARARGILAVASPAPEGWEQGGVKVSVTCPAPVVRDGCVDLTDTAQRPTIVEFGSFLIRQGSECSTLSGDRRGQEARDALSASTDYALGLTLRNGVANDSPALDDATSLGQKTSAVAAVAAIECAASSAGKGAEYVLHASPGAAAYLAAFGLIDDLGRSPSGAPWIISAGYECSPTATHHRIWATGRVWAGVSTIDVHESVARRTNDREAWAVRAAVVGFNTCINLTAEFALVTPEEG